MTALELVAALEGRGVRLFERDGHLAFSPAPRSRRPTGMPSPRTRGPS